MIKVIYLLEDASIPMIPCLSTEPSLRNRNFFLSTWTPWDGVLTDEEKVDLTVFLLETAGFLG